MKTLGGKLDNVIVTPASGYVPARELFGSSVTYKYLTIPDWVAQIANSKLLITPSFHGVVLPCCFIPHLFTYRFKGIFPEATTEFWTC